MGKILDYIKAIIEEKRAYRRTQTEWFKQGNEINMEILLIFRNGIKDMNSSLSYIDNKLELHLSQSGESIQYHAKRYNELKEEVRNLKIEVDNLKKNIYEDLS